MDENSEDPDDSNWEDISKSEESDLEEYINSIAATFKITAQKQTYEFVKKGESEWQIVKPKTMRADSIQTDDLVQRLKNAEMDLSGTPDDKKTAAAFGSARRSGSAA